MLLLITIGACDCKIFLVLLGLWENNKFKTSRLCCFTLEPLAARLRWIPSCRSLRQLPARRLSCLSAVVVCRTRVEASGQPNQRLDSYDVRHNLLLRSILPHHFDQDEQTCSKTCLQLHVNAMDEDEDDQQLEISKPSGQICFY